MKKSALVKRCFVSSLIILFSMFILDPYITFSNSLFVFAGLMGFFAPYVLLKPYVLSSNGTEKRNKADKG